MSIQTTAWPLVLEANDFQRIDRGIKWGIKFHEAVGAGIQSVHIVWTLPGSPAKVETIDDGFDIHILQDHGGDVLDWIRKRLLPRLNAWLAKVFPANATNTPAPPPVDEGADKFTAAWAAVGRLQINQAPDGTLTASLP